MAGVGPVGRPAEVLLGASLIGEEEIGELLEGLLVDGVDGKIDREAQLGTGVKSVDDALHGGLKSGNVVGIWSESGSGGPDFCRALLVDSLLKHSDSAIAVIDAIGNFDVLGVYKLILSKLTADAQVQADIREALGTEPNVSKEDVAAQLLDHVKIMRVFDFVGVREAISEIRDGLEGKTRVESKEEIQQSREPVSENKDHERGQKKQVSPPPQPKRTLVADSEDEEDEEDTEEMLFDNQEQISDAEPPIQEPADLPPIPPNPVILPSPPTPTKTKLILLDNLAHVLNPPLKNNHTNTTHLATTFLQALANLTCTHNLYTFITNPATHPRSTSPSRQQPQNKDQTPGQPAPPQQKKYIPPPPPSIFASNDLQPGLMGLLGRYVDVGLLVGNLPRRTMDARVLYKDLESKDYIGGTGKVPRGVEMVSVVEVMSDRFGGSVGGWGVFGTGERGMKSV